MINNQQLIKMSFDGTPLRKKARFSQHPQIFQYSSKSKKANDTDNDSLLLDLNYDEPRQNKYEGSLRQKQLESQINGEKEIELQLKEITSDLAEIEAYLNQQSKPIIEEQKSLNKTPIKLEERRQKERFSFNFKPQLKSGRQTMNVEQQLKVRSITKQMSDDISNNKKKMMSMREQQKDSTKNIDERIGNQIKKNKRITMDVKQLINMINDYNSEDQERKLRENRKNRITMDVFALSKMLETVQLDENTLSQKKEIDRFAQITPEKTLERSNRKNCIFSTFKQKPHQTQIKLFVQSYLSESSKRLKQKQAQNKRLSEVLSDMKSDLLKSELKISDKKKKIEQMSFEKASLQSRLKKAKEQLNSLNPQEDIIAIQQIEKKLKMQILKCEINEQGCYGHFIFENIFLKAKSKTKFGQAEVKFSASNQSKYEKKFNYFSIEECIKILKLYHKSNQGRLLHFLDSITSLRKAYEHIKRLDNDIYYLSLAFEVANLQIDYLEEKLSFQVMTGGISVVLVSIKIIDYMGQNQTWKSIGLYSVDKGRSICIELAQQLNQHQSTLIEMFKKYISQVM